MDQFKEILKSIKVRNYQKDSFIVEENDKSNGEMYYLLSGKLGVYKEVRGTPIFLSYMNKGIFFGEISLILGFNRTSTVKVESEEARVGIIDRKVFTEIAGRKPDFLFRFLVQTIKKIIQAEKLLNEMIPPDSAENLYKREVGLGINLSMNQIDISEYTYGIPIVAKLRGEEIFKEGANSNGIMCFIIEGNVGIYKVIKNKELEVRVLSKGEYFGEMALIVQGAARSATVRVLSNSAKIAMIDEEHFKNIGKLHPDFYFSILKSMYLRLIEIQKRMDMFIRKPDTGKTIEKTNQDGFAKEDQYLKKALEKAKKPPEDYQNLVEDYRELSGNYEKLLKQTKKIVKLGDENQKNLLESFMNFQLV